MGNEKWAIESYRRCDDPFVLLVLVDGPSWIWHVKDPANPSRKATGRANSAGEAMRRADKAIAKLRTSAVKLRLV
jgi:hypothetical protein